MINMEVSCRGFPGRHAELCARCHARWWSSCIHLSSSFNSLSSFMRCAATGLLHLLGHQTGHRCAFEKVVLVENDRPHGG